MKAKPWPTELLFKRAERALRISFDDGCVFDVPFELLRVESPSAEVRGHGGSPLPAIPGKEHVGVHDAAPVGRYGVRISFDDGHDTGLFSWDFLYALGENVDARMAAHRDRLRRSSVHHP